MDVKGSYAEAFARVEMKNSVQWNRRNFTGLQKALSQVNIQLREHSFVTYRKRDVGFFTKVHTKTADLAYRQSIVQAVINNEAKTKEEKEVKFDLIKRNFYHGDKKRVGALALVFRCADKDSAYLQRVMIRAQKKRLFINCMKYNPFGMTHQLGEVNFINILRQQNDYCANIKTLPLYQVDKDKLGKLLGQVEDDTTLLQRLNDEGIVLGVEDKSEEDTVYFYGTSIDLIKTGLREYVLEDLIYGRNRETHVGKHQINDVPQEDIQQLIENEEVDFKCYDDIDYEDAEESEKVYTTPERRQRRQQVTYAAVASSQTEPDTTPKRNQQPALQVTPPPERKSDPVSENFMKKLEAMNAALMKNIDDILEQNRRLQDKVNQLEAEKRNPITQQSIIKETPNTVGNPIQQKKEKLSEDKLV